MSKLAPTIKSHPFFNSVPPEHLEHLLKNAQEVAFQPGEFLFRESEPANRFYLVQSGRVAVEAGKQHEKVIQMIASGEVLGWSWLFPPFAWHFSARATEPTQCVVLDGGHLLVAAEENPEFGYDLMRRISQILVGRLQITRQKMLETPVPKQP